MFPVFGITGLSWESLDSTAGDQAGTCLGSSSRFKLSGEIFTGASYICLKNNVRIQLEPVPATFLAGTHYSQQISLEAASSNTAVICPLCPPATQQCPRIRKVTACIWDTFLELSPCLQLSSAGGCPEPAMIF